MDTVRKYAREEAGAVLDYEVALASNGDRVTLAPNQSVLNTFVPFVSRLIGHTVDRVMFRAENGHGPAFQLTVIVADLVLGIQAVIIVMKKPRRA